MRELLLDCCWTTEKKLILLLAFLPNLHNTFVQFHHLMEKTFCFSTICMCVCLLPSCLSELSEKCGKLGRKKSFYSYGTSFVAYINFPIFIFLISTIVWFSSVWNREWKKVWHSSFLFSLKCEGIYFLNPNWCLVCRCSFQFLLNCDVKRCKTWKFESFCVNWNLHFL